MPIKYALVENLLTTSREDYLAKVVETPSKNLKNIIERMVAKGSTITKADTLAVLTAFFETVEEITSEGESVNTELFKTRFSIQGTFAGADAKFDPKVNTLKVNLEAGKLLKKALENVSIEKTSPPERLPKIGEVKDIGSGTINTQITSQGVVELMGSFLKVVGTDARNGVYFVASDGTRNKVSTFVENKPSRLILLAPTLTAGDYTLEVTTQYSEGGQHLLKTPRTGLFKKKLVVS